jgi:hypothetical protein
MPQINEWKWRVFVCPDFQNVNRLTDFHETCYEYYVTGGRRVLYLAEMRFLLHFFGSFERNGLSEQECGILNIEVRVISRLMFRRLVLSDLNATHDDSSRVGEGSRVPLTSWKPGLC